VAAPSLNASELRFLRALLRRKVRFMVVGLVIPVLEDSLAASKVAARRGTRKPSSPRKRKSCR
jgi:hypothetical protein